MSQITAQTAAMGFDDSFGNSNFAVPSAATGPQDYYAEPPVEEAAPAEEQPTEIGHVIAPFVATAPNQLSVQPGDVVKIRVKSPTGWIEGEMRDDRTKSGWIPGNYVKVVAANEAASEPTKASAAATNEETVSAPIFDSVLIAGARHVRLRAAARRRTGVEARRDLHADGAA